MTVHQDRLFRVIDVQSGNEKEWSVYVPTTPNLRFNLEKLKRIIDLYLEDLPQ